MTLTNHLKIESAKHKDVRSHISGLYTYNVFVLYVLLKTYMFLLI